MRSQRKLIAVATALFATHLICSNSHNRLCMLKVWSLTAWPSQWSSARATRLQSHDTHVLPQQQHQSVRSLNRGFKRDYSSNKKLISSIAKTARAMRRQPESWNTPTIQRTSCSTNKAVIYRHGFGIVIYETWERLSSFSTRPCWKKKRSTDFLRRQPILIIFNADTKSYQPHKIEGKWVSRLHMIIMVVAVVAALSWTAFYPTGLLVCSRGSMKMTTRRDRFR